MKDFFIGVGLLVAGVLIIVGISFGGLWSYRYFAPRYEDARRKVFKETRSYNEGKMQQLAKYRYEYLTGTVEEKTIIGSTIRHMFADYESQELPIELRNFLDEIKGGY